ncbi:MAG: hypothetical protein OXT65_04125 [Alphaproteobacteria bacterium]|nr:hypothetical protein [Alphaproteobacteria bacterium]
MLDVSKPEVAHDVLEHMAFGQAADAARPSADHASRVVRLPHGCWQAKIIADSRDTITVRTVDECRAALEHLELAVIFVPHDAGLSHDRIADLCRVTSRSYLFVLEAAPEA